MLLASPPYAIREAAAPRWEQLLAEFPAHSVFHSLPWFQTIQAVHGAQVRLTTVDDDSGLCAAIWPVFTTRKGPLRIAGSPVPGWCTAYLGPLFAPGCDVESAIEAFVQHDAFRRSSYFSCKVLQDQCPIDLSRFGFEEVERLNTYCLDLTQTEEQLWDGLKSECRTRIRKARKLGLEVRHEVDASFLDEYWRMSQETFAICNIQPPFTRTFAEELWRYLRPAGRVCAMSCWHAGERIATLMLPFDQHTMYYWGGASYTRCRGLPAHNLLHWEAITHARNMGLRRYDFVSTEGGGGRFKKTFGPQEVHVATHWERTSSLFVKALKSGYQQWLLQKQRISA